MVEKKRKAVQVLSGLLCNGYVKGFMPGKIGIYEGPLKRFCVPGMNCYSCPAALGACPIGSLQAALNLRHRRFPFYLAGYLTMIGVLLGRFVCGWLCLFGLLQEFLYKIPVKKITVPEKIDQPLRYLKYLILLVLVIGLPLLYRTQFGAGIPFFCEFVCPVGTLEGGVPLVLLNDILRPQLGWLFSWKMLLLIICILACMFIYRPFCRYICPLGAIYALFQKIAIFKMKFEKDKCIDCGKCASICQMKVDPRKSVNSPECIRCGLCNKACPNKAISFTMMDKPTGKSREEGSLSL